MFPVQLEGRPKSARRPTSTSSNRTGKDINLERGPLYHQADPLVRLKEYTNETKIIVDMVTCNGLVDFGAQISTITNSITKALGLKVYSLGWLLGIERVGGIEVLWEGYVEVIVQIPEIRVYNKDVLML